MARRSSIARYASATPSSGSVRSKTFPGLIFRDHTRSMSSGRNRRCSAAIWLGLRDNQVGEVCRGERMMPLLFVVGKCSFSG